MTSKPTSSTNGGKKNGKRLDGSSPSRDVTNRLSAAYREAAADKDREAEAQEWLDAVTAPLDEE